MAWATAQATWKPWPIARCAAYDHLVDPAGDNATALVRFFITKPYAELDAGLQRHVDGFLGQAPAEPRRQMPDAPRHRGRPPRLAQPPPLHCYRVHPLSKEIVDVNPMFAQVAEMFGIVLEQAVEPDPGLRSWTWTSKAYNIFHVPGTVANAYIPDQQEFVIPYGIRSVLGFYGLLPSGNLFTVILFAKVPIPRESTDYFRRWPSTSRWQFCRFDDGAVFATDPTPVPTPAQENVQLRARMASLGQLLRVHERVVRDQSDRIAQLGVEAAVAAGATAWPRDLTTR
ncbi:MAG: hypothetical protein R3A10_11535 [Caldilineaceae bacterium]